MAHKGETCSLETFILFCLWRLTHAPTFQGFRLRPKLTPLAPIPKALALAWDYSTGFLGSPDCRRQTGNGWPLQVHEPIL